MRVWCRTVLIALLAWPGIAAAEPCAAPDNETRATGTKECLVLRTYRAAGDLTAPTLVAVLHGDVSGGGAARYHFRTAQRIATEWGLANVVAVALVRPGYDDGRGGQSTGDHYGRRDHYTDRNIDEIAAVIGRLRAHHRAGRVVLIGHSGGAAIAGVAIGRHPGVADAAILVACPCDIDKWRDKRGGRAWGRSLSPSAWADKVPVGTRVVTITGAEDTNTEPVLAADYVARLAKRGVAARAVVVPKATHNSSFRARAVKDAVIELAGSRK